MLGGLLSVSLLRMLCWCAASNMLLGTQRGSAGSCTGKHAMGVASVSCDAPSPVPEPHSSALVERGSHTAASAAPADAPSPAMDISACAGLLAPRPGEFADAARERRLWHRAAGVGHSCLHAAAQGVRGF